MNTKITYLYRDADNYKEIHHVVVAGEPTDELIDRIMDSLQDGEYFVPDEFDWEWGMETYPSDDQSDHPFCELASEDIEATDERPTCDMTIEEVAREFERCYELGWENTEGYSRRMGEIYGF